jgi:hypothetical protein
MPLIFVRIAASADIVAAAELMPIGNNNVHSILFFQERLIIEIHVLPNCRKADIVSGCQPFLDLFASV